MGEGLNNSTVCLLPTTTCNVCVYEWGFFIFFILRKSRSRKYTVSSTNISSRAWEESINPSSCVELSCVDYLPGRGRQQLQPGSHSKPAGRRLPDQSQWDGSRPALKTSADAGWTTPLSWPRAANRWPALDQTPLCRVQRELCWAHCTRNRGEGPTGNQPGRRFKKKKKDIKFH